MCASTAALVLKALDPFRTGETALYHVKYDTDWHGFEIGPFIVLGFIGVSHLIHLALLCAVLRIVLTAIYPGYIRRFVY